MNITKEQIKEWLDEKSPEIISFHSTNMNLGSQGHLISLMEQCFNDLAPKWVSVDEYSNTIKDGQLCWVHFPCDSIKLCRLNNYKSFGGAVDFWQDMEGNDLFMNATKFLVIATPEPPK